MIMRYKEGNVASKNGCKRCLQFKSGVDLAKDFVSHDLRSTIGRMKGLVELLSTNELNQEENRLLIMHLREAAEKLDEDTTKLYKAL